MAAPLLTTTGRQLVAAVRAMVVLTVILGLAYPLTVTGLAQLAFNGRAGGSLVERDGKVVGSTLIGQSFAGDPAYFQSRPSAAGKGYDPLASGASNLGPDNPMLLKAIQQRKAAAAELDGVPQSAVAPDALLASGSGLDPHISPAYAEEQVDRIAANRGLPRGKVRALVDAYTDGRSLGFLGEPRVNVLELNLALDRLSGPPH